MHAQMDLKEYFELEKILTREATLHEKIWAVHDRAIEGFIENYRPNDRGLRDYVVLTREEFLKHIPRRSAVLENRPAADLCSCGNTKDKCISSKWVKDV